VRLLWTEDAERVVELRTVFAPDRAPLDEIAGEVLDRTRHFAVRKIDTRGKTRVGRGIIDEVAQVVDATRIPETEYRARDGVVVEILYCLDDCRQRDRLRRVEPDVRREFGLRDSVVDPEPGRNSDRVGERNARLVPLGGAVRGQRRVANSISGIAHGEAADVSATAVGTELKDNRFGVVFRVLIYQAGK